MQIIRQSPSGSRREAAAFTLVELLVTIVIIAALVSISMFGFLKFRNVGDRTTSMSNIRQLQIANMQYAGEHNGNCVPIRRNDDKGNATRWFSNPDYVDILTGLVFTEGTKIKVSDAPLNMLDPKVVRAKKTNFNKIYASYGMNATGLSLGGAPNLNSAYNMNKVRDPARAMAFATATDFRINYAGRYRWNFDDPNDSKTSGGELAYRHGDKILVVYFDGHVGEMSKADLQTIDRTRGGQSSKFWRPH